LWFQGICATFGDACFIPTLVFAPFLGGHRHSCPSPVRLVIAAGAGFTFFAGGDLYGVQWLFRRYVTPFPSLLQTALAKPSVISLHGTWPPMHFRGHSNQLHPLSKLFQQIVIIPVLSWYFGSPSKLYMGTLHAWQIAFTKMRKSFVRRGSMSVLILGCQASFGLIHVSVILWPCWYCAP
jgi:hypothetical protein